MAQVMPKGETGRRLRASLTNPFRRLPHFVIIGAQKCGTTYLFKLLGRHPNVEPASIKEIHYFDLNFDKGINWYKSHFPLPALGQRRGTLTGEASPYYLCHPHAPARLARTLPKTRLIVLLRNPVDRAYSHYQHRVRKGIETLSFEEALEAEEQRLSGEVERMLLDESYYSYNHQHFSYLSRGIYVDQISVWADLFGRERMLILNGEELFRDPRGFFRDVRASLGLPHWEPRGFKIRSERRYEPMNPATRQRLIRYFEPHNERLYEYLGTHFGW